MDARFTAREYAPWGLAAFPPHTRGCTVTDTQGISPICVSPHTRGCTVGGRDEVAARYVSPAHAGMYRYHIDIKKSTISFPRTRGDVPLSILNNDILGVFPPHTRGCTESGRGRQ